VASAAGRQIVASAGYDFQPVVQPTPPAPPPPILPAPVQAAPPVLAAKPAARTVSKAAPKSAAGKLAVAASRGKAAGAKSAVAKDVATRPAGGKPAAPEDAATEQTTAPAGAGDEAQEAGPRRINVPPGSPRTLEALKALTTPDASPAKDAGGDTPHPRTIYLPASARLTFGTYQPLKMPTQPPHLVFVRPDAAIRPGSLKVDCKIGTDGIPSDCREIAHEGTAEAAAALMAWLPSGGIRYTPVVKDGHTVEERRVITVTFGGKGGAKTGQ
jgi:hypothetical protein